jgi:hypothetical protein
MLRDSHNRLCYLEAGQVTGPCGGLKGITLSTETDEALGTLDGVLIDPSERRIRYFVVHRRGWLRSRRFLLSADRPAQITNDRRMLRLPVEPEELTSCEEFDARSIPRFSDDHLLAALFGHPAGADEADAA